MAWRPQFGKFYTEAWPYDSHVGVGMEFKGVPNNEIAFIDLLQGESCNPVATRRIYDTLLKEGVKLTTVMASLNFERIGLALEELGVTLRIIPPVEPEKINDGVEDRAVLALYRGDEEILKDFPEEKQQELRLKMDIFKSSVKAYPHHFGNYENPPVVPKIRGI